MHTEKRSESRKKTFMKGRILFNGGASSMDCLIRDMSEHGARLELTDTAILPEVFDLYILHKDTTYRSNVRWRNGGNFGVSFGNVARSEAPAPAPASAPVDVAALQRRILELEVENATLRSLIGKSGSAASAA